jgi:Uma2 family endonuclease
VLSTVPSTPIPPRQSQSQRTRRVPPLEQGDRLTRDEFFRRYALMPDNVKAERIEGMVHMAAAAVSAEFHGQPHADILGWLAAYRAATPGVVVADNSTILLDTDNDPQPDACLRVLPSHGGPTKIDEKGYIVGSPDLIVEIAASSMSYDLHAKLNVYRRNGVQEYIVWRTYDEELDWFVLREGQYERASIDSEGLYRSRVFPGLWLKADALLSGELAEVLAALQKGLASEEHVAFVKGLGEIASKT